MPQPFACNSISEDKMASYRCFDMPIDHRLKPLLSSRSQKRSQIAYGSLQSILGRIGYQLKNGLEYMMAVLPWFSIGSSEGCRFYCRWCAGRTDSGLGFDMPKQPRTSHSCRSLINRRRFPHIPQPIMIDQTPGELLSLLPTIVSRGDCATKQVRPRRTLCLIRSSKLAQSDPT